MMGREMVELLLAEAYRTVEPGGCVSFAFQGGEPTLAGLDFFRYFVGRARALVPEGVELVFSIQTNGILLDENWARFFYDEGFLVGISIDGTEDIHNAHRVDAQGKGTWTTVRERVALLQRYQVETNALCVVTRSCAREPQKVYEELKALGFRFIQFIACLDPLEMERGGMPYSLLPEDYGTFLCQMFDLWYEDWEKGKYHSIRLFEDYVHILLGDGSSTCATCGQCGSYFVVEGDGSVYPCDFYALDEWRLGRLDELPLEEMAEGAAAKQFFAWGREKPAECGRCRWRSLCNGGCKNDWMQKSDGYHNYYCTAFQKLFEHGASRILRIAQAERRARMGL